MKKIKFLIYSLMLILVVYVYSATNGISSLPANSNYNVLLISWSAPTDDETKTFVVNGNVLRIVVDVTNVDADGDITISDVSGANYLTLTDKLGSGDIDYIVPSVDQNDNVYGGVPVAGINTITLTDCAAAGATNIFIYIDGQWSL